MIEWFEVAVTPPPEDKVLLTKGIETGSYYDWDASTGKRSTELTEYSNPWKDIGNWRDGIYDSAAISSDKNSYELWREFKPPTHWAYLD